MSGKLFIVGTPIGNLGDLSPRAVDVLKSADTILCEDTRHTRKLLAHFGINRPAESYHEHNEAEKAPDVIRRIEAGETFALVSDAGLPIVSDPGYRLVRMARAGGIQIEPVPGPFAAVLALVASGIAPLPFTFLGFSPHRRGQRRDFYRHAAELGHTVILYESPERVVDSLQDAGEAFGDADVTIARELTKLHEELINGSVTEVLASLRERPSLRGEITLVLGAPRREWAAVSAEQLAVEFQRLRDGGMRRNDAVKAVAEKFALRKNDVYRMLLNDAE